LFSHCLRSTTLFLNCSASSLALCLAVEAVSSTWNLSLGICQMLRSWRPWNLMQTRWQHSRPELPSCYQMWSICCQETAQSWKGADQPFDAVLLFHCLYYIPQLERPALFKKLFDNVVANGGLVFIVTSPCNLENTTSLWRLFERLSLPSYSAFEVIDGVQVRDMMTSVGFHECYQLPIEYQLDAEEPNDDLMSVFVFWSRGMLSLENVREAANEVFGNEICLPNDVWFGVFEKKWIGRP